MKKILLFSLIIFYTVVSFSQKYKIYNGDTINRVDENNLKQGLWIYFNDEYKNKIVQKGQYVNNKKEGVWQTFYPNGNLKSEITYKNNKQTGPVKIYYEDGTLQETGYWKYNKWVGEYKYYYPNGNLKYHWFFDESGKRTGTQEYFYESGKKQISGQWVEGKETGKITEYYENGNVKKIADFEQGKLNGSVTEYYSDGQIKSRSTYKNGQMDVSQNYAYEHKNNNENTTKPTDDEKENNQKDYEKFTGTGYYKFVNAQGLIEREGQFDHGIMVEGKRYFYDENGKLLKTAVIKNGRIVKTISANSN